MKKLSAIIIIISLIMSMIVPCVYADEDNNNSNGSTIHISSSGNTHGGGGMNLDDFDVEVTTDYSNGFNPTLWSLLTYTQRENISNGSFSFGPVSVPLSSVLAGLTSPDVCLVSSDGHHHADSYNSITYLDNWGANALVDHYNCTCKYCGESFECTSNDIKSSYQKVLSDKNLQNMTKNADGSLDWQLTWDDIFSSTSAYCGIYIKHRSYSNNTQFYVYQNSTFPVVYDHDYGECALQYIDKYSCSATVTTKGQYCVNSFKFSFDFVPTIYGTYYSPASIIAKRQDGTEYIHSQTSNISVGSLTNRTISFSVSSNISTYPYSSGFFLVLPKIHIIPGSPIEQEIPQTVSVGDTTINVTSYDFSNMTYYGTDSVNNYNYSVTFYDNSVSVSHVENNETIINNYYYYMPSSGSGSSSGSGGSVNVDLSSVEQLLQEIYDLIEDCGLDSHDDPYLQSIYSVLNSYAFGSGSGSLEGDFSSVLTVLTQIRTQLSVLSSFTQSELNSFTTNYNSWLSNSLTQLQGTPSYYNNINLMTQYLVSTRANVDVSNIDTFDKLYFELMLISTYDLESAEKLNQIANLMISQGVDIDVIADLLDDLKSNSDDLLDTADSVLDYLEDVVTHNAYEEDKLDDIYEALANLVVTIQANGGTSAAASTIDHYVNWDDIEPEIDLSGVSTDLAQLVNGSSSPFSIKSAVYSIFSWISSLLSFVWDFFSPTTGIPLLIDSFKETTDFWETDATYSYKPYKITSFVNHGVYENSSESVQALFECAEQFLGYPYVWGGSSPSTSFDCSGFVYYVLNASGVFECSRTTAQGFYNLCTPVSAAEAKPGDLIFFSGTYNTSDTVTHIGFYAGDDQMLHCGDPIQYTSINTDYWQSHFYAFGRLPYNDDSQ